MHRVNSLDTDRDGSGNVTAIVGSHANQIRWSGSDSSSTIL
jgi:hypothetical protein